MADKISGKRPETGSVVKREMAARLERIESAFTDLSAKLKTIRQRYEIAADSQRILNLMLNTPDNRTVVPPRVTMQADVVLLNLYALADTISTLVQLELAASDYRVMVGLLRDDLDEGELPPLTVSVYDVPDVGRKEVA